MVVWNCSINSISTGSITWVRFASFKPVRAAGLSCLSLEIAFIFFHEHSLSHSNKNDPWPSQSWSPAEHARVIFWCLWMYIKYRMLLWMCACINKLLFFAKVDSIDRVRFSLIRLPFEEVQCRYDLAWNQTTKINTSTWRWPTYILPLHSKPPHVR